MADRTHPPKELIVSLFRNPAEHAANPPSTWTVAGSGRRWKLCIAGTVIEHFDRKRDAEDAKTGGRLVEMYDKETRWYAGEPVAGWKPYSAPDTTHTVAEATEDTPAQKWRLIGNCIHGSPRAWERWVRMCRAMCTVHGLPVTWGAEGPNAGRDGRAIKAARDADPRSWDEIVVAYLAAYAALLGDDADPVDLIALPFAETAQDGPHLTPATLTPGARILVTERSEYAGEGGTGKLRPAVKVRRPSWAMRDQEPAGVLAATVVDVCPWAHGGLFDVLTTVGPVEGVTGSQRFRVAPAGMRDAAEVAAEIAAAEAGQARPRDVDGNELAAGDLVEQLDAGGGGRKGRPYAVTRVLRISERGVVIVARPREKAYGEMGDGEGLAINSHVRKLTGPTDGHTAARSCGCPTPILQPVPPPARLTADLIGEIDDQERRDRAHRPGCHWADQDDTAAPALADPWAELFAEVDAR